MTFTTTFFVGVLVSILIGGILFVKEVVSWNKVDKRLDE
jgi:uncharacterized membrane protein YciS (DUF1049 family)